MIDKTDFLDMMRHCWAAYNRPLDGDTVRSYYEEFREDDPARMADAFAHFTKHAPNEDGTYPPTVAQISTWMAQQDEEQARQRRAERMARQREKWAAECDTEATRKARDKFLAEFRALMAKKGVA